MSTNISKNFYHEVFILALKMEKQTAGGVYYFQKQNSIKFTLKIVCKR